jgi:hypothetical protein
MNKFEQFKKECINDLDEEIKYCLENGLSIKNIDVNKIVNSEKARKYYPNDNFRELLKKKNRVRIVLREMLEYIDITIKKEGVKQ